MDVIREIHRDGIAHVQDEHHLGKVPVQRPEQRFFIVRQRILAGGGAVVHVFAGGAHKDHHNGVGLFGGTSQERILRHALGLRLEERRQLMVQRIVRVRVDSLTEIHLIPGIDLARAHRARLEEIHTLAHHSQRGGRHRQSMTVIFQQHNAFLGCLQCDSLMFRILGQRAGLLSGDYLKLRGNHDITVQIGETADGQPGPDAVVNEPPGQLHTQHEHLKAGHDLDFLHHMRHLLPVQQHTAALRDDLFGHSHGHAALEIMIQHVHAAQFVVRIERNTPASLGIRYHEGRILRAVFPCVAHAVSLLIISPQWE